MAAPTGVLVCPPEYFDVVDVKNPHMEGSVGRVDRKRAREQWGMLVEAFHRIGLRALRIAPVPGCEDMTFTANQTLTGVADDAHVTVLLSRMRHASRRREVPAFRAWFEERGWRVVDTLPEDGLFEGAGDVVWHPGRHLAWAGHGFRSSPDAHPHVAEAFGVPVLSLALHDERFYHLDTCLCPLDERAALVVQEAFDDAGLELLAAVFDEIVPCDPDEAVHALAANAVVLPGRGAVIDQRAPRTADVLARYVDDVVRVDTGEFLKSGGSVFCLKQWLYGPRA